MNTICRLFSVEESKDGGVLNLIRLHCEECEIDKNDCDVVRAYDEAKRFATATTFEIIQEEIK